VALEFKIDGFVHCDIKGAQEDGSVIGLCRVNVSAFNEGEDLSAYLLEEGWAVALPDAPFEYQTLEKIAQNRSFGVWGMPVDSIRRGR
jgi:endonuclease YncB( thermonuclease family)